MFKYIVIEGIDGAGKTTFINLLKKVIEKRSKNLKVFIVKEPFSKSFIKNYLSINFNNIKLNETKNVFAFALDRTFVHNELIKLKNSFENLIVISDRSFISSMAYQFHLDYEWIFEVNKNFLMPDLVIYLDVNVEIALKRIKEREKENKKEKIKNYERKDLLKRIRERYKKVLEFLKEKKIKVEVVNSNLSLKELENEIERIVDLIL
jgi:dTMP kinase